MKQKTTIRKSTIKEIVKECLIEILSEGIGSKGGVHLNEVRTASVQSKKRQNIEQPKKMSPIASKIKKEFINEITGGGIMAEMMSETLSSGRADEFVENDLSQGGPVGAVEQAIYNKDPSEMFGDETVNQWASLAFSGMNLSDEE